MGQHLSVARRRLQQAAAVADVDPEVVARLSYPNASVAATLWLRMDDGSLQSFKAWRCRYDDTLGPTKGGLRFHPSVNHDEVLRLAFWMTIKCALAGLPLGGAKGGVQVDAKRLSMREREGLSRAYIRAFAAFMGPDRDIPAPDMYTDERVMAWMADEYDTIVGRHVPDAVTGKPVILGGIAGRIEATARGGVEVLQGLEDALGLKPRDTRAVVQGFGNVGYHAARLLCDAGYVVAGISDSAGAVYDADGLDPEAVMQHKRGTGSVGGAPGLSHEDLLEQEYELLVPAATADSLTADNVGRIKAKAVLELANGAVTPNADETLQARGVTVIPDVLANVGGVTVSSYELIQNRSGDPWSRDRVHERLRRQMQEAAEDVLRTSRDAKIALRCAAYVRALHRIAHAVETYGTRCNDFGGRPKS